MENGREASGDNRRLRSGLQDQRLMNIVDQTQPVRRETLTRPIEEGASNFYGQAGPYEDQGVDSDSASLLHAANQDVSTGVPSTQPVEPHSPGALSQIVTSAGMGQARANEQEPGDRQESFGVRLRSGFGYPSTSGFSSYGMNEPSGGHLRPILSASSHVQDRLRLGHQQFGQQDIEALLRHRLGDKQYELLREKSEKSFSDAGIERDIGLKYATCLLIYIDVKDFEKVKCALCGTTHDIGSRINHASDCLVQGYDQVQRRMLREDEGQPEPRGTSGHEEECEGSNMVPPRPSLPQRPSETIGDPVVEEGFEEDRHRLLLEAERNENLGAGRSEIPWIAQPPMTAETALVSQQIPSGGRRSEIPWIAQPPSTTATAPVSQQGPSGDLDITQTKTKTRSEHGVDEQLRQMGYTAERIREIRRKSGKELNSSVEEFCREEELYSNNSTGVRPVSIQRPSESYHTAQTAARSQPNTYQSAVDCRHPEYADIQARRGSFKNWPADAVQTPDALAEAGLFYTGHGDVCRCFACTGTLQKWEPTDNAWFEHARFFPQCPYVQHRWGQAYIDSVLQKCRKKEKNPTRSNQADLTPRMEKITLEDPLSSPVAQQVLEMGYTEGGVREAIIKAKGQFGAVVTTEQVVNILLWEEESVGSLTTNSRMQSLSSESASSLNLMDASICKACNERTIAVSQCFCGHIVCDTCAPNGQIGGSCKICGQVVVKVMAYDPAAKSRNP